MFDRLPTDFNLWTRGCGNVSMCSLCEAEVESTSHIFYHCAFVKNIWNWLSVVLNFGIDHSSISNVLAAVGNFSSSLVQDVVAASIINVFWVVWHCRNKIRFDNKKIPYKTAINLIIANVSLTGNCSSGYMTNSMQEFVILKAFYVACKPYPTLSMKEVIWISPPCYWVKFNTDGAAKGAPGPLVVAFSEVIMQPLLAAL